MSTLSDSAALIAHLYELRTQEEMRAAREWFATQFDPTSADDIVALMGSSYEGSARYRMVTTYWEMACTFVTHGAIDASMFHDANTEHVAFYAKLEPYLSELRKAFGNPRYLANLEKVAEATPDAAEEFERRRRLQTRWAKERERASNPQ
jgi:hypothetical protein